MRSQIKGFLNFVRTQGVLGLAVGFILGKAVSDLVGSFVNDIVNPIIGLFLTRFNDLGTLSWTIHGSVIGYGKFISLLINFLILAAIVYFGIKGTLERFDRPKLVPPSEDEKGERKGADRK